MSAFTKASVGTVPTRGNVSAKDLFTDAETIARFRRMISGTAEGDMVAAMSAKVKIAKYKVEIFDLSDVEQREQYEKLWVKLFDMVSRGEAFVDARKDLVHRPDGTSFWMKYVEYATLEIGSGGDGGNGKEASK